MQFAVGTGGVNVGAVGHERGGAKVDRWQPRSSAAVVVVLVELNIPVRLTCWDVACARARIEQLEEAV